MNFLLDDPGNIIAGLFFCGLVGWLMWFLFYNNPDDEDRWGGW
jgi:hypothetical protein